jgi:glycosyltransferase 2 family protein
MRLRILLVTALGFAVVFYLIERAGVGAVLSAAAAIGWGGFGVLCLAGLALFLIFGPAWAVLVPRAAGGTTGVFIWARAVRDSASEVLPFSQLGGMALGVRAAVLHGVTSRMAVGSMIVDVTTEMLAQIGYAGLGVAILVARAPRTPLVRSLTIAFSVGLALAAVLAVTFLVLQCYSRRWAGSRLVQRVLPGPKAFTAALTTTLDTIYRHPRRVALSLALHFGGWIMSAAFTWVAFRLVGARVDLAAALAIDSLVYATRSAAFVMPSALGVQEAAYTVLAPLVGVGKEFGLAVSLLKRARDIAIGIPILLIWQAMEGRRAFAARDADRP